MATQQAFTKRWLLAGLMATGVAISYLDRANLSQVITVVGKEFYLSPLLDGVLLSAFSLGYVGFMLVGGVLVDRIGPTRTAGGAVLLWSGATILSGGAKSFASLLICRIAVGAAEAPIFPANARLTTVLFPLRERGKATALFDGGSYVGLALGAPLVAFLAALRGWRVAFVVCGILGFLWVITWLAVIRPFGAAGISETAEYERRFYSYRTLFANRRIVAVSCGFFCYNYVKTFYLTWLPAFLIHDRQVAFLSVGVLAAAPAIAALGGEALGGFITDYLADRGDSLTMARKIPLCCGLLTGSALASGPLIKAPGVLIALLSISFAGLIAASPAIWALPGDLAPHPDAIGRIGAAQNTVANLAGVVAPVVTGGLLARQGSFSAALILTGVIAVLSALSYGLFLDVVAPLPAQRFALQTQQ